MKPDERDVHDFHREVSLMFLKNTSGLAVRTPRGQKDPGSIKWDPKSNTREKSQETILVLERNTDNLGVHLFGPLVDVDIDSDNPTLTAALDMFLPHTSHIWGRPSRPRTHRLYELIESQFDPSQWAFLNKIKGHEDLEMEVRGGELKSAQYSLLPGSIHPSGEQYLWHDAKAARSTVVHVGEDKLMQAVRFALAATLMAKHWIEGARNDLCKAFSGFLFKAATYNEELNADLPFTKEEAWELLRGVMDLADDDPADITMRQKTFEATWEKGESGAPVTGATRIAEITGDESIVGLLYALLANTPDLQVMDEMFEQFAVVRNTMNIVDLKLGSRGAYMMNKDAFVFTHAGKYIQTAKSKIPVSAVFLNSQRRVVVDMLTANPTKEKVFDRDGMKIANIWSGWAIPPCEEDVADEEVQWFKDYVLQILACGDTGLYSWIMMWVADIFQNPANKPGTALVLVGEHGAGKSMLPENILRPIIGAPHSFKAGTLEKLNSKFNQHLAGRLLIQGEEVMNSNRRTDADALKDAIMSRKRSIEIKGRDVFEIDDMSRYIFTSNHVERAVNVETGDRRYTICEVSSQYAYKGGKNPKRAEFFGPLFEHIVVKDADGEDTPNVPELAKLHKYLMSYPVNRNFIMEPYETNIKRATQYNSTKGIDAWLLSMIERVNPFENMRENDRGEGHSFVARGRTLDKTEGWPEYVQYSKLEQSLRLHTSRDYGESKTAQQLAKFFKDNGLIDNTEDRQVRVYGQRVRVRPFPSRQMLVEYLTGRGFNVMDVTEDIEDEEKGDGPDF